MIQKIFIDCGFHHGEGLKHFINQLGIDEMWYVYAFEANPECKIKTRFYDLIEPGSGCPIQSAVWIHDSKILFRQENHFKSESGSPTDGNSIVDGWASQVDELHGMYPGLEDPICVKACDFSLFVKEMALRWKKFDTEIYCKMDIEGSEFPVLRKMLDDDTVKYIKKIWIEFHEQYIPGESEQTKRELIKQLSQFTQVEKWH